MHHYQQVNMLIDRRHWTGDYVESLAPFERDIHMALIAKYMEEQKKLAE